ncbi:glycosyltransferase family 2 protein [Pseudomonas sp.]|uniref:glycosyltransferase family 2 protein n=1 Tax=Pseudomonas sp. TaxID=306 RepID=UPI0028ADD1C5|nr:glycosyltransferase family 2 protein [Pseudomonas sp.]
MRVYAVVLTYNRQTLLKQCLEAVYSQTRPCDGVIVIDNASTDGTERMLMDASFPGIEVHVLSNNIGAAGGFSAGFRIAYQAGADFVWMMDDDVIPDVDALERLMDAESLLAAKKVERAFLLSTPRTETGLMTNTPSIDQRLNAIAYESWPLLLEHGLAPVARATFVSILVPRATIEKHGLPIAQMFIWGEDTEYTLRMTRSVPGYMVGNSKVQHLRQTSGALSIRTETNATRLNYHRHFIRNELYVAAKYRGARALLKCRLRQVRLIRQFISSGQLNKAYIVFQGLMESFNFSPVVEAADSPLENLGVTSRLMGRSAPVARPESVVYEGGNEVAAVQ